MTGSWFNKLGIHGELKGEVIIIVLIIMGQLAIIEGNIREIQNFMYTMANNTRNENRWAKYWWVDPRFSGY